jgi:hypothetical protein
MSQRFQFSLKGLMAAVLFAAVIAWAVKQMLDRYYIQLHTVDSVLADFPEIDKVWLWTNDDVTLEVQGLWFSTVDQPAVVFGIEGIDGATKSDLRKGLKRVLLERHPVPLPAYANYRLR